MLMATSKTCQEKERCTYYLNSGGIIMESFISLSIKRIEYFTSDIRIYCVHIFLFNFQLRNGFIICPNPGKKTDKDNIQNILKILFLHIKNTRHVSNITTIIDKNIIRAVKGKRYILKKTILN